MENIHLNRALMDLFEAKVTPNKVLLLLGARRVGKTQLINAYIEKHKNVKYLKLNGDDMIDAQLFKERSVSNYKKILSGIEVLIIDEAQHIPEIGLVLKLIVDEIKGIKVIATGSSMFDLSNKMGEPLVGRKNTLFLFPFAQKEFSSIENVKQSIENLEERLLYGGYPELTHYSKWDEKRAYLQEIVSDYLLKDILIFDGIKHANKIYDLLRLLAYQVGKEVSVQELGNQLQLAKNTVDRYLDLLSKVFVIYKIEGFSRNLRKEITKTSRWYFYDNGIRNAVINNFNKINFRDDIGLLWENYLASERVKKQHLDSKIVNNYFWRTYDGQEIDWIETYDGALNAFEFKWNAHKKIKIPAAFSKAYPDAGFSIIDKTNYLDFIV